MRFATRLTLMMALLATACAIALSSVVSHVVDRSVEERAQERLQRESALLADEIAPLLGDTAALDRIADRAARRLGARVTIMRADGVVIADSEVEAGALAQLENHAARPEIVAAQRAGDGFAVRHSATLARDLFYLAHRIDPRGDVVRLALPYDELRHLESQYEWRARAAIAAVCFALFVTAAAAVRMLVRPLRRASDDALLIAAGDTKRQLHEQGPLEIVELASAINRMKQALLDAAAGVERERQLGAAVFATLPDGTLVVDRQWRIVEANPRARELLRADCTPGQPLIDALRDRELFVPFEEAVRTGSVAHATVTRAGDVTWEVSAHPLPGDRAAAVGIIHDVTPFRQNEAMRRRFIADVSHELRTPVASIGAAAETLATQDLSEEDARSLTAVIGRQTTRVRELLDDLTDLTLIESGQIQLEHSTLDLAGIAREVAADVEPAARQRGISIVVNGNSARIEGDHRRVAQIVRNLIDNAVKFSADGSAVRVGVETNERQVVLSVADSGEGIPERELSRIFQRFYQVDRSRSKARPGSGLGLAIVKHLAQLHRATVDAESALGVGSTFRVRFPRMQEES
ncbi:MAG: ATP-binding protein [Acidobacteriota bacterium]|nr:ATP-binding protein [Acidobacteriota bacterium]